MTTNPYMNIEADHVEDLREFGILPHDCFQDINGYVPMTAAAVRACKWTMDVSKAASNIARDNRAKVAAARKAHAARRAAWAA